DEREAVFETLDEGVAAEALEEVDPKVKKAIVESLDSNRAAEIVEEMEPDAAADLLGDLPEERTSEILLEMKPEERREMVELLDKYNLLTLPVVDDNKKLTGVITSDDIISLLRAKL